MQSAVATEQVNREEQYRFSPEKERQLAMDCARGDEQTVKKLVNALVVSIAKNYKGGPVPLVDLVQEGSIGLLEAARSFDHTKKIRFSAYAKTAIRNHIHRYIRSQKSLIRVKDNFYYKIQPILEAKAVLTQEMGEEPTLQELARKVDMDEEKLEQILQMWPQVSSLDEALSDSESTLQTYLESPKEFQPHQLLIRSELRRMMEELLSRLDSRQQWVLRLHFGMEDGVCHSFGEIGEVLGVSAQRVRQIATRAMEKLRIMGVDVGLEDFLN